MTPKKDGYRFDSAICTKKLFSSLDNGISEDISGILCACYEPACVGAVDAARRDTFLQPADLGPATGLCLAIHDSRANNWWILGMMFRFVRWTASGSISNWLAIGEGTSVGF
jgi:hypothetical protein